MSNAITSIRTATSNIAYGAVWLFGQAMDFLCISMFVDCTISLAGGLLKMFSDNE